MRCSPGTARHIVPETERVGGQVYVAEALLYNEFDLKFSQHGQVIAAYGKNFAKTQALDPKFNRWLRDGFDKRITDDYGVDTGIEDDIVAIMINQAHEFLLSLRSI
jgi:uncharacterized protein (UPF0332 family)